MTSGRFEDLPVWKASIDLSLRIDTRLKRRAFNRPGHLRDHISRATLSVSNDIADGIERGSVNGFSSLEF